jgi:nucleotide-binding universal stress UspA family protein
MHPVARHVLVACEGSRQGDEAVRQAADMAARMGAHLSLIAVAVTEQAHTGCCDLRSVYWNGVEQELAARDVARARRLLGPGCVADTKLVGAPSVSSGIADAAKRWGADLIVLPAQRRVVPRSRHQRARQVRRRIPPEVALVTAAS